MIARIQIACEESNPYRDIHCGYIDIEVPPDLIVDIPAAFKQADWTHDENGYHCPRHNPALTGLPIVLTDDYIEPVPGVRIRVTGAYGGERIKAEILLDPTRYRVVRDGGLWEVEHASENRPT